MKTLLVAACLALPLPLCAQDWIEVRFDRIHLNNGNFVDGKILEKTPVGVELQIPGGQMMIRYTYIDRIELVKMRGIKDKPIEEKEKPKTVNPGEKKPDGTKPVIGPEASADARTKVDALLKKWRATVPDGRLEVMKEFIPLGKDASTVFASMYETFNETELQQLVQPVLAEIKDTSVVPKLIEALSLAKPYQKSTAAGTLAQLGDRSAIAALLPLMKDPNPGVRGSSVNALHELNASESITQMSLLGLDPDQGVRNIALTMYIDLCKRNDRASEIIPTLASLLEQSKGPARADIALVMGRTGDKETAKALSTVLGDEDPNVRAMAVVAIANLEAREYSNEILDRMGREENVPTRSYLASAADKLKIKKAIPVLIEWLSDKEANVQSAALVALRGITGQSLGLDANEWKALWDRVKGND